ncbi:heavy metal-associated isoprenylated plant protein 41 isoform X1 [Manihot esculenta]|uniref:Uncharacterized protein n=1 Tax=Manihot esculenta TaxID=3983 RepID=A0ACB7IAB8_MANES|nr:heavy metal-associated isoprenylated plant protein 41 isoform X1 [Manihot esculenta]KAG8661425.1 hypothetical protein MANES_01G004860v8 [Manihot esculenta]
MMMMKFGKEKNEEIWVKHYSSNHHILLVGEGDFSFSSSLARAFGSASNIVATSLDPYDILVKSYKNAKSNLENLVKLGASTLHGVDAIKMRLHSDLKMKWFDRIVFNFPHAGFHGKEDDIRLIEKHKRLVLGFFNNASGLLRGYGEIHITHKTSAPFSHWNIEELAWRCSLSLIECVSFKLEDYPGYKNKRGDGVRCDEPFPLRECSTFKFRFAPALKKNLKAPSNSNFAQERPMLYQDNLTQYWQTSFCHGHDLQPCMNDSLEHRQSPLAFRATSANILHSHFNHASARNERAIIRSHPFQGTSNKMQQHHQPTSYCHMDPQTSVNLNYSSEETWRQVMYGQISVRKWMVDIGRSVVSAQGRPLEETGRQWMLYGQRSVETWTSDFERSVLGIPRRTFHGESMNGRSAELKSLVLLYGKHG